MIVMLGLDPRCKCFVQTENASPSMILVDVNQTNRKISRLDEGNVSSDHQPKYNPNSIINQLYSNL